MHILHTECVDKLWHKICCRRGGGGGWGGGGVVRAIELTRNVVGESEERGNWARSVFPATTRRQYLALARSKNTHSLQLLWRGFPLFSWRNNRKIDFNICLKLKKWNTGRHRVRIQTEKQIQPQELTTSERMNKWLIDWLRKWIYLFPHRWIRQDSWSIWMVTDDSKFSVHGRGGNFVLCVYCPHRV